MSKPAFNRAQAEAQAGRRRMARFIIPDLATKDDLKRLESLLKVWLTGTVLATDGLLFALLKINLIY